MTDMNGKHCLVTGGTSGIGRAAALGLARLGASVVIVGRDAGRTGQAVESVRAESGNPSVEGLVGDLSSIAEVRRIAREYADRRSRLDVLLNAAGAYFGQRLVSSDGYEMTFALNHLGYFALTRDLLDQLRGSAPARVVSIASGAHRMGHIDFDDLMGQHGFSGQRAYNDSKLANVMFTFELARRLDGTGVTANCMHPGVVRTNFGRETAGRVMPALVAMLRPFMLTPERGADTAVYLAASPEVQHVTGQYYAKRKVAKVNRQALDRAACARLWDVSEQLVDAVPP